LSPVPVEAHDHRSLTLLDRLDRAEAKDVVPPRDQAASANDELVGMVGMPLVADVIKPADVRAVARHDTIALGGGKQATEFGLPFQPLLGALIATAMPHGREA
jgi:hypothetical protein